MAFKNWQDAGIDASHNFHLGSWVNSGCSDQTSSTTSLSARNFGACEAQVIA